MTTHAATRSSDLRSEARWQERRHATLRWRGKDWRARTENLSCGGVMLAVEKGVPQVGDRVTVTLRFEAHGIDVEGIVRHVRTAPWGSIVGVEFDTIGRSHLAQVLTSSLW